MLAQDISPVGLDKARALAASRHMAIETLCCDLAEYGPPQASFDLVVAIWMHLPPPLRAETHRRAVAALRPGGHLILEGYTPRQLAFGTGGPPSEVLLERVRWIEEGPYHRGQSAVVQALGRNPG